MATLLQWPREDGHFPFLNFCSTFTALTMMFLLALATEGQERIFKRIVYTRDWLTVLCKPALLPQARPEVPKELQRRCRGCRARVKQRAKRRWHRPAVPVIVMGNVRSLGNKTDELTTLTKSQREYRECSCVSRRHGFTHTPRTTACRFPASALFWQMGTW